MRCLLRSYLVLKDFLKKQELSFRTFQGITQVLLLAACDLISFPFQALVTLNLQVALFRDLLLDVGSPRDGPNLR